MTQSLVELLDMYNAAAPLEEAYTIPAQWYLDRHIEQAEREEVFGANWIAVGRIGQVAVGGQFFTVEIAGEPLVVVRGSDGELRAFFNVCRHHAAPVANVPCGTVQHLRCPYHGWTYGLDGSLKGAPEFAGVCNFDRGANGLVAVRVETWEQFIFVTLDPGAAALMTFLGDLPWRVAALKLADLHFFARKTYTLACNWKVYVDNYLDGGYHVPHLHKGLNSVLDYTKYTIENFERACLQSSPLSSDSTSEAGVAATRQGRAFYLWLYPNFMINAYEGVMDTNLVLPLAVDRCAVVFDYYFADTSPSAEARNKESVAVSEKVQDEDVALCDAVQRGLGSRAYIAGRLSLRREAGEHLFHRLLYADLTSALNRTAAAG